MNIDNAYTDNALYGMRKKNGVNYQLTGGFRGELSSVRQENSYSAPRYSFYTIPRIEWERTDFLLHCLVESSSKAILFPFLCRSLPLFSL